MPTTPNDARLVFYGSTSTCGQGIIGTGATAVQLLCLGWFAGLWISVASGIEPDNGFQLVLPIMGGTVLMMPLALVAGIVYYRALWSLSVAFHDKGIDVQRKKKHFVLPWSDVQALSITEGGVIWPGRRRGWFVAKSASHITDPQKDPRAPLGANGRWFLLPLN